MGSKLDHWIETYEIIPPIAGVYGYGAKPRVMETGGAGCQEVPLGECHGRTEEEARRRAQAVLDKWLSKQTTGRSVINSGQRKS